LLREKRKRRCEIGGREEANGYRFCSETARILGNEASFMNEKKLLTRSKSPDTNSVVVENNADVVADLKCRP